MPEPSPYFWAALNRRVQSAIAEAPRRSGWVSWLRWDTVVPLMGMAVLLMALAAAISRPPAPPDGQEVAAADPAAAPGGEPTDDALALVVGLAGTLPEADGDALPLSPLPDIGEVAAMALTDDELQALEQLLREAVDRPKS